MVVSKRTGQDLLNEEVPSGHMAMAHLVQCFPRRASLACTETDSQFWDILPGGLVKDKLRQRYPAQ